MNKNYQYVTNPEERGEYYLSFSQPHPHWSKRWDIGIHRTFLFQVGLPVNRSKKRTLEELFKPPLDLMWQVIFSKYTENVYKGSSIYHSWGEMIKDYMGGGGGRCLAKLLQISGSLYLVWPSLCSREIGKVLGTEPPPPTGGFWSTSRMQRSSSARSVSSIFNHIKFVSSVLENVNEFCSWRFWTETFGQMLA